MARSRSEKEEEYLRGWNLKEIRRSRMKNTASSSERREKD